MVDVPPGGEGDGEAEKSEMHLSGPGRAKRRWRVYRNRLKIVAFLQISGGGSLLLPVFFLQLFPQEAATLAGVPWFVLFLAEVSCNERSIV